jgi:RNA polymerase I-specific transcription initiation factor RRN6
MYYKGTVALTSGVKAVLSGDPSGATTPYGDSCMLKSFSYSSLLREFLSYPWELILLVVVNFTFETGNPAYKDLENATFVAAGHFVKEAGQKGLIVEYKVSKVVYNG